MTIVPILLLVILVFLIFALLSSVRIVNEYERGVVYRLGRLAARAKGPGFFLILPFGIDKMRKVNLQVVTMNVPPQDVITRDNVTIRVDAVIYFQVVDPGRAVNDVQNYLLASSQVAQTTLRAILGKVDLDDLLSERDRINDELARIIDDLTEPWGVKVSLVEIKDVDLPASMQRAMARQAEAERDRRARIIQAEGEFQASTKLSEAAAIMSQNPQALQLRFLQTVVDVASEKNSTLVMPIPVELLRFFDRMGSDGEATQRVPSGPRATPAPSPGPGDGSARTPAAVQAPTGATAPLGQAPGVATAAPAHAPSVAPAALRDPTVPGLHP